MRKMFFAAVVVALILAAGSSSRADGLVDPVGFCAPPATVGGCTTATGVGGETISVGATAVGMFKNGNGGTPSNPWLLLILVPNDNGGAPVISFSGGAFTQNGSTTDGGQFLPSTAGSIYDFTGTTGDGSMNASNLFGPNTTAAFGGTPSFFEVFEYSFSPDIANNTPYEIDIAGAGLVAGTYLAAAGGSNPFSTPFTITGLVSGPVVPSPEPSSLLLLGSGLLGLVGIARRRVLNS